MKNLIVVIILSTVVSSCATVGTVQLEVLRPAKDSLNLVQNEVSFVNGFLHNNAKTRSDFKDLVEYDKYRLDSLISVEALRAVYAEVSSAGFAKVRLFDSTGMHAKSEGIGIHINKVDVRSQVETEPVYVGSRGAYYAAVMVYYELQWEVSNNEKTMFVTTYRDTVWAEGYEQRFETLADLVNFNDVIKYIIDKTSIEFAQRISPTWNTVTRYYVSSGSNDFTRAAYLMEQGKYEEASEIWTKYVNTGDGTAAANAHLNLAVYYELKGNIDEALVYARRAVELKSELASTYLRILEQRQNEILFLMQKLKNR